MNETISLTDTNGVTALVVTNVTWSTAAYGFATNAVVVVTITGGDAVMTNLTVVVTPNLASNSVVGVTITRQTVTPTATVTKQTATVITNVTATNP